ncbi:uncharacterized protein si:dkey-246e1.3 isoform X2 [Channa argus]|uniref:uncharacterized protein si:dkey-246e1.3 isoform X2 n=1 Tax=Channa argus TaxID=215402 RepID=UPI003522BBFF
MTEAQKDGVMTADSFHLNGTTTLGLHDEDVNTALFEFKVFNVVIIALTLCILTVCLYGITVCYNRTRKQEAAKDNSRIYYIYSNPLPVGLKEEEEERRKTAAQGAEEKTALMLSFQEYASDPNSGVILDPPIFYMQL